MAQKKLRVIVLKTVALFPFALAALAIFSVSNMSRPPLVENIDFRFADKVLHAGAYGILSICALIFTWSTYEGPKKKAFLAAFLMASFYGISDEIHQSFVEGRSATLGDAIADATGAAITLFLIFWVCRCFSLGVSIPKKTLHPESEPKG